MTRTIRTNRWITSAAALASVPVLLLGLAACSSADTSKTKADTKASASLTGHDWDLAHAKCMRAEGIDYFKDPVMGHPQAISVEGDYDQYLKADETCKTRLTKELGERPVSDEERKAVEADIEASEKINDCLRKAGYDIPKLDEDTSVMTTAGEIPESAYEKCGAGASGTGQ